MECSLRSWHHQSENSKEAIGILPTVEQRWRQRVAATTSISSCRLIGGRVGKDLHLVIWVGSLLLVYHHHFTDKPMNLKEMKYSAQSDMAESLQRMFYLARKTVSAHIL